MQGTLKSRRDIQRLFEEGARGRSEYLTVLARRTEPTSEPDGRVLIVAGRAIGGAVKRNRAKRVVREALRRAGGPWPGFHVAVIARPAVVSASAASVDEALARALAEAGVER